jgi:hypothetical protein
MDRERLKEVHQTDLTESKVNEDFVEWLKTKGPSWLLVVLVAVCAYLAMIRWRQHKTQKVDGAWAALREAPMPGSKGDVALEHGNVFGIPQLAWTQGAEQYLFSIQTGVAVGSESDLANAPKLTDEDRTWNLDRAAEMYDSLIETDDGSLGMAIHTVSAMNGHAAIAEARGDMDSARMWYERAAGRAEADYPALAERARQRAASLDELTEVTALATGPATPGGAPAAPDREPARIEPALRDLLVQTDSPG